jgi:hypothetical protein
LLAARGEDVAIPAPAVDHSRLRPSRERVATPARPPSKVCDENPLADFIAGT